MSTTKTKSKNPFAKSMFEAIKSSLATKDATGGNTNFRDILRFESGNTYLIRLVPNIKNPEKTFYHYFNHGWNSLATGKFMSMLCPSTYGETCPIDQERFKIWRNGTEEEKNAIRPLKRKEAWMVNAYVISDPTNPENEGKVKIMRYGAQLNKIIEAAINGDDADEFGAKIFDLSENGCTFRIKAEPISENARSWTNYTSSRFLSSSEIPGMTDDKIKEIYGAIHDLESMEERKSYGELKDAMNTHFYQKISAEPTAVATKTETPEVADEDELDLTPTKTSSNNVVDESQADPGQTDDSNQKLDELLADL